MKYGKNKAQGEDPIMKTKSHKTFPSTRYDEKYYTNEMTPGFYGYFVKHRGRLIVKHRMDDLDLLKIYPGMKLLDLGCGRGELVMFCGSKGINSYGLEYSEAGMRIGQRHRLDFYNNDELRNIHLIRGNVTHLPFPGSYFDRVMSWQVLEHLYQWQLEKCLDEIYRVLKPNGIAVLDTSPNEWYQYKAYRVIRPVMQLFIHHRTLPTVAEIRNENLKGGHMNLLNPISLKRNLQKKGFTCRIYLKRRKEFETKGIYQVLGSFLETIPVVRLVFRAGLVAIAAKSTSAMKTYSSLSLTSFYFK